MVDYSKWKDIEVKRIYHRFIKNNAEFLGFKQACALDFVETI
jgi:hypothetical protein